MAEDTVLVVGLGNPGPQYAGNRHNAGFRVLGLLAERAGGRFKAHKARADVLEGRLAGRPVVLAQPRSFMNESGGPVAGLTRFYKIPPERLVVVHDELDLPPGRVKVKVGGGIAGHNGLRSIQAHLHSPDFVRVRIGIGKPPGRQSGADHVLRRPSRRDRDVLDVAVSAAADAVELIAGGGVEAAMNRYNGTGSQDGD
jgi:peptidyl-tRNA hydrolase, PTH1 family